MDGNYAPRIDTAKEGYERQKSRRMDAEGARKSAYASATEKRIKETAGATEWRRLAGKNANRKSKKMTAPVVHESEEMTN